MVAWSRKQERRRPIIGITAPDRRFVFAFWFIHLAVWICGGRPVSLTRDESLTRIRPDGLILGGGTDVFPDLYSSDPKQNYLYDHNRDRLEMSWMARAAEEGLPVMGICRGAQMMNVVRGGSLHLDVSIAYENAHYPRAGFRTAFFRKPVDIEPGSLLNRLTGETHLRVNSMHTQAIDRPGNGVHVTAREVNGVVQAIELDGHDFWLGVQFHPEFMIWRPSMQALLRGLVRAARMRPAPDPATARQARNALRAG